MIRCSYRILSFIILLYLNLIIKGQECLKNDLADKASLIEANQNIKKLIRVAPDSVIFCSQTILDKAILLNCKTEIGNSYNYLGIAYYYLGQLDSSLHYNNKALYEFENIGDSARFADVLINLGNVYYQKGDFDSAQYLYSTAFLQYKSLNQINGLSKSFNNLANCYNAVGDYKKAVDFYFRALEIEQKRGSLNGEAICNNNIGIMYHKLGDGQKALQHYNRAYKIYKELGIKQNEASILNQIASCFLFLNNTDTALYIYNKALEISTEVNYEMLSAVIENNLGELNLENLAYSIALRHFKKAYQLNLKLGDDYSMAMNLIGQAKVHNFTKASNRSIPLLVDAYNIGNNINSIEVIKFASEELSKAYEASGDFQKSLKFFKRFKAMDDSTLNHSNIERITALQMKYDFDILQQKQEFEQYQKDLEYQHEIKQLKLKRQRVTYLTLSIILIISISFLTYFYRQKIRISKLKIAVNKNMQRLLGQQMNPHFIFNTLKSIQSFILKSDVKNSNIYLVKFSKLIRKILENSQTELISLKDELEALQLYMEIENLRLNNKFDFQVDVDENIDGYDTKIPSLLFQPFVENSIWHGISPKQGKGEINISVRLSNKSLKCTIVDNGVGRSGQKPNNGNHKSLGSSITDKRIRLLNSLYSSNILPVITDLKDSEGQPTGTKIEFGLPLINV